ncbi:hypothetical protein J6590_086412, partial [Homalodisca vitripennis]
LEISRKALIFSDHDETGTRWRRLLRSASASLRVLSVETLPATQLILFCRSSDPGNVHLVIVTQEEHNVEKIPRLLASPSLFLIFDVVLPPALLTTPMPNLSIIIVIIPLGKSLLEAMQLAGAPMWPLQRPQTTDENTFLRKTDWRSIYTAVPARDGELAF